MQLIRTMLSRLRHADQGFAMVVVMGVLLVGSMLVAAAYAAADGDVPQARESQDSKTAYAAAEAGLEWYLSRLNADNAYWARCTNVPAPSASEQAPVNNVWNKTSPTQADPRKWRKVTDAQSEYTIELLPAPGYSACNPAQPERSMLDPETGAFKLRATGRSRGVKRTVVASFRRRSFLEFLYFTDYEVLDPSTYETASSRNWATANCTRYRASRPSGCQEIVFANADRINGPFHTNDDILTCGSPVFGRTNKDSIEMGGPDPGWTRNSGCSGNPNFQGVKKAGVKQLEMPASNTALRAVADAAYIYQGQTTIRINGATMDVTTDRTNDGVNNPTTTNGVALPPNGVIYVEQRPGASCNTTQIPLTHNYGDDPNCGNLYVYGTYAKSLTMAAQRDIIVGHPNGIANGDVRRSGDVLLGLIANNFVRIQHRVTRTSGQGATQCTNRTPEMRNVTVEAAILSLDHSFIVDNYACGNGLGTLSVTGAIAQRYRGPVGLLSGQGFIKNYTYDDRLRYRNPPYFLSPIDAAWRIQKTNEQVPAH